MPSSPEASHPPALPAPQVLLVGVALRTRRWKQALATARRAAALAGASPPGGHARARAAVATALALSHLARETPALSPSERSKCRAEARALLEPLAGRGGSSSSGSGGKASSGGTPSANEATPSRAEVLYYLALLQAEGGHYRDALETARDALAACAAGASANSTGEEGTPIAPSTGAGGATGASPLLRPAVLGLLALLLSPHQPRSAMTLVDAALAACPPTGSSEGGDETTGADTGGGGLYGAPARGLRARGLDITLLRLKAALCQSLADAGGALEALASARQRLSAARAPGADADDAAAREYALSEAQVGIPGRLAERLPVGAAQLSS
jgi:hypothetical protein